MSHKWYIAQAYSGYEKKVAASIMEKVKLKELDDSFDKIVVPTEEVVEVKNGKKRNAERKFFPGQGKIFVPHFFFYHFLLQQLLPWELLSYQMSHQALLV